MATPEIISRILEATRQGLYVETAAALAGVNKDTLYRWVREDARGEYEEGDPRRGLSDAVLKAGAEADRRDLGVIQKAAADGVWQAAAWRLERRRPSLYGLRTTVRHTIGGDEDPTEETAQGMPLTIRVVHDRIEDREKDGK